MTQRVYENGFQFKDKASLRCAIRAAWDDISLIELNVLNKFMPHNCAMVIVSRESTIDY